MGRRRRSIDRGSGALVLALAASLALGCGARKTGKDDAGIVVERPEPARVRAPEGGAIEYTLRFPAPHTHYVEVEGIHPTGGRDAIELVMAVWTPGSYLVREYARNVDSLTASTTDGEPLRVDKTRKNRWRVATGGADRVVVRYPVYARELSVQTCFVDADVAVLNGACIFLASPDDAARPYDVALEIPDGWRDVVTSLPAHAGGRQDRFVAADYDTLVDSPIVLGTAEIHRWDAHGIPHTLATLGGGDVWDHARAARDVERIVAAQHAFWRVVPYERYVFQNLLFGGGGGLEHRESTMMIASAWDGRARDDYLDWLGLVSHEFFHTWNVKRLRPAELGPFDYESEVHTRSLWVAEGFTSYYDDLLLSRSGLMAQREYLERLSKSIESLQTAPGRLVQSLADASFDAWIKFYRHDENSRNTDISYYRKGAVVAFLLDARIRDATRGTRSLDDVMRLAWERFSSERGYTPEEFRAVASEVAGTSLDAFFAHAVDGTGELDYQRALDYYGLRFARDDEGGEADGREGRDDEPAAWIGAEVEDDGGRFVVTEVRRGTPAFEAGLNVGDEILAIGDHRIPRSGVASRLERYRPGEHAALLVSRRGVLRRIGLRFGEEPEVSWRLEPSPNANAAQRARLRQWLGGHSPAPAPAPDAARPSDAASSTQR